VREDREKFARYETKKQRERELVALRKGGIRSCLAMARPDIAASAATNIPVYMDTKSCWITIGFIPPPRVREGG
jgi:hypothetical protein